MVVQLSFEDRVDSYFHDLKGFLDGRLVKSPSLKIYSHDETIDIVVYIDRQLARRIVRDCGIYKKHFVALRHGYVEDKKGLNGIRNVHANDGRVYTAANNALSSRRGGNIMVEHDLNLVKVIPIKIVAHDPSLRRLYGFMDTSQNKVILIGVEHYK